MLEASLCASALEELGFFMEQVTVNDLAGISLLKVVLVDAIWDFIIFLDIV